ncbi:MAG: hypothetical protein ABIJ81_01090 [Patescibacteria group bacterium]
MAQISQEVKISWWQKSLVKYYQWWILLVVLVILVLPGWWLVRPIYLEWRTMTRAQDLESRLVVERQAVNELQQKINAWEKLKQQTASDLQLILPSTIDIPNLLVQLEAIVEESGYRLRAVSVSEAGAGQSRSKGKILAVTGGIRPVKITLSVEGEGYNNFKELLQNIQLAWRLLDVNSFRYGTNETSFVIELTSFYYPR